MNKYDVIIAGGGPAGCTSAALLAQQGYKVLLLEKGQHPRFHIGESMMPEVGQIMHRLGIDWSTGNIIKNGAEFIDEQSGRSLYFPLSGKYRNYQIERSVFDQKLFINAQQQGVDARQQEAVKKVNLSSDGVQITSNKDRYQGRYFIDATGRSALMGRKQSTIKRLQKFGRFALYQHFHLAVSTTSKALFASGHIKVLLADIGWIWIIPLTGQRLSLGLVVQKGRPEALTNQRLFEHYTQASPYVTELLSGSVVKD